MCSASLEFLKTPTAISNLAIGIENNCEFTGFSVYSDHIKALPLCGIYTFLTSECLDVNRVARSIGLMCHGSIKL
jgi:hypothetical protein